MTPSDFRWLMRDAGFQTEKELATFFEVTERTVRNWQRYRLPKYEVRAIAYVYLAAGIERARLCPMLQQTTPIHRGNRCRKAEKPALTVITDTARPFKRVARN
ncbi:hypothetical protein [Methylomarinum vadi]|uniref:hypothetical protein n=1 Tax=Methylomarinum vadi TaxID=438855 RepID=UPI001268018F|nr:hypothetical protein [Methylomarinum vadi]